MNTCVLKGRLGRDPEIRYFESGKIKAEVSIAVKTFKKDDDGKYISDWFDIEVWGKAAEVLAEYAKKGDQVLFRARAEVQKWEDKTTGDKRQKVVFVADECDPFLNGSNNN